MSTRPISEEKLLHVPTPASSFSHEPHHGQNSRQLEPTPLGTVRPARCRVLDLLILCPLLPVVGAESTAFCAFCVLKSRRQKTFSWPFRARVCRVGRL